jgi:hypothetical protein
LATAVLGAAAAPASTDTLRKPPLEADPRLPAIEAMARSADPGLFDASAEPGFVALTLLMNPDGTLRASFRDQTRPRPYTTPASKAFAALGVAPDAYGDRVQTDLLHGGPAGATRVYVRAFLPVAAPGPAAPNDDPAVDRAIAEKYFPDLYTYTTPPFQDVADFWVLLARDGRVLATGRRYLLLGQADLRLYLESLYPGIRTTGFQPVELRGTSGRPAVVNYTWLAADSPVSELSRADASRRGDVAVYATIQGDGSTGETTLAVLRFGTRSGVVCDDKDLDLEISARDGGRGFVILQARIQRVPRMAPAQFEFGVPNASPTAWPAMSPPIRLRYGESTTVRLVDQQGHAWQVALHPDRLHGTINAAP